MALAAKFRYQGLESRKNIEKFATSKQNCISGCACDHYHIFKKDFNLLKSLGANSCRISIEWSRIEPEAGRIDNNKIRHYHDVIDELIANNIELVLTL